MVMVHFILFIFLIFLLHFFLYLSLVTIHRLERFNLSCKMERFAFRFFLFVVFLFHFIVICVHNESSVLFHYNLIGLWMITTNLVIYHLFKWATK
jgi:hypothetical protein